MSNILFLLPTSIPTIWLFCIPSYANTLCYLAFTARIGMMHIGVFIILLLSGERNFGVRLNKPYSIRVPMDIPVFTGSHADLLIVVSAGSFKLGYALHHSFTVSHGDNANLLVAYTV